MASPVQCMAMTATELEEQFRIVDINRDGFIDAAELRTVMNNLGVKSTDEEIKIILEQADHNGSGKIEEEDFMHVMKEYTTDQDTLEARELFDVFDTDKDGFISRDELTFALSEVLRDDVSKKEKGFRNQPPSSLKLYRKGSETVREIPL
eukprot:sb/3473533/